MPSPMLRPRWVRHHRSLVGWSSSAVPRVIHGASWTSRTPLKRWQQHWLRYARRLLDGSSQSWGPVAIGTPASGWPWGPLLRAMLTSWSSPTTTPAPRTRPPSVPPQEVTVVVLGKGHERGQEIAGVVHPFDDRAAIVAALHGTAYRPTTTTSEAPGSSPATDVAGAPS